LALCCHCGGPSFSFLLLFGLALPLSYLFPLLAFDFLLTLLLSLCCFLTLLFLAARGFPPLLLSALPFRNLRFPSLSLQRGAAFSLFFGDALVVSCADVPGLAVATAAHRTAVDCVHG
jgi:hypothetical protein